MINRAGFGQVRVDNGVDECFGRGFVGCFTDGFGVHIADKKVGGFELSFVFTAGGNEELLWVMGANAQVSAGTEEPSVVVKGAGCVEHVVGCVCVVGRVMRHGKSSLDKNAN